MTTILLIEDDVDLRKMLSKLLQKNNYEVFEAGNGLEAFNIMNQVIPDMVVTDIIMPEQDGIGTINTIKKRHPEMKIIAISGGGKILSKDYLNIAKLLGASHIFTKPFDNNEFLRKISELLSDE